MTEMITATHSRNIAGINIIPGEPVVPFLGELRVTILYIPFIPAFLAVLMNAVNMLEGYNGEGSGTSIIVVVALLVGSVIMSPSSSNFTTAFFMSCILLFALIAFFIYNKFPARIFPGDIGTLQVGMMLGCIAILGNMEFVLIIAIMPHIFNAFHVIRSVRGFKESKTIQVKDIILIEGDLIKASTEKEAPMTIPRIITAHKPISEPKLVFNIIMLNVVSTLLSIFSSVLVQATLENHLFIAGTWIWALLVLAVSLIIAFVIPPIRGLVIVFLLVFFGVLGLLLFIDLYVIGLELINWLVAGFLAFGGLLAWYMLSMRYFNHVILRSSK
jgi:UDP-N-acetylmuramyl pentapeptide phosphotransferase/UDP-N-acetylglucosamine-1-phosphate transferase